MPSCHSGITSSPCEGRAYAFSGVRFYDRHVRGVYNATGVHIRTEVAAGYRLANLTFGLSDVGGVDDAVAACVADEHVHTHWRVRQNLGELVGHAAQSDSEYLHVGDTGQVNRHGVTGKDWRSRDGPDAAGHGRVAAHHVVSERKHLRVVAGRPAGAAFYARISRERERNVERASAAVCLAGNGGGEHKRRDHVLGHKHLLAVT